MVRRLILMAVLLVCQTGLEGQEDAYAKYVRTSGDFRAVRQDRDWCLKAFPSWTYMPWTFQWTIGYTPASAQWSKGQGYNGAFVDHGDIGLAAGKTARLDWINQGQLRFYMDHTAGKGDLHLWDGSGMKPHANAVHGNGVRVRPVNEAMKTKLEGLMREHILAVKPSPYRAAYALDDEISWGHFIHPCMWKVTDDAEAYPRWLKEVYGSAAPERKAWITYNEILPKLATWNIATFDASPLMDQWTFNDAYWCNFLGELVEYANSVDPETPCGFVGGQAPNAFGGYDYARIMRKVQYIESYNAGSSQAIIRSFNPQGAIPSVTTHFHKSVDDDIWQVWYYLVHGNRGMIGWVENWFDGQTPKPWQEAIRGDFVEAASKIGPLLAGAKWKHDGIAIYYSHPSIQLGWILDAQAHGKTWVNRNGDERLGASHHVRHAWENMLRDSGLQYDYVSYVDVIQKGVSPEYRVLILPACLCLSDVEARRIREFCQAGGTVIADYLPGVWDQHGKGRPSGGALDDLFGVKHGSMMTAADVLGGKLWCEVDQDANFSWKTYAGFLTNKNTCVKDPSGYDKAVRQMETGKVNRFGKGTAVLMNLSPQWYNAYREAGLEAAKKREVFMGNIARAGVERWVELAGPAEDLFGYEVTYFEKDGRTIVCVCANPELSVSSTGGGNSVGLKSKTVPVTLRLARPVKKVRDERSGRELGEGEAFKFDWKMNAAIVVSYESGGR